MAEQVTGIHHHRGTVGENVIETLSPSGTYGVDVQEALLPQRQGGIDRRLIIGDGLISSLRIDYGKARAA
ncbi:MAG: hypothetical protein IJP93_04415, partial [Bacteroidales bacterium]|nr:hypothetical protein [Bacteroidales bacterium]